MKHFFLYIRRRNPIIYAFLFAFLFPGTGTLTGLPLFYATVAHAHPVFISEENNTLRLTFHHPGNHDLHERASDDSAPHRHDLFDRVVSASENGRVSHTDHVVELPAYEDQDSSPSKNGLMPDERIVSASGFPYPAKPASSPVSQRPALMRLSLSSSIRSTILRI